MAAAAAERAAAVFGGRSAAAEVDGRTCTVVTFVCNARDKSFALLSHAMPAVAAVGCRALMSLYAVCYLLIVSCP